jgi:hypothetical protein
LVEIEITLSGLPSSSELRLQHFQLGGDYSSTAYEAALGDRRVVEPAEISDVLRDQILASPNPRGAPIDPG